METIVLQVTLTRPRINAMDLTDFNFLIIPTVYMLLNYFNFSESNIGPSLMYYGFIFLISYLE